MIKVLLPIKVVSVANLREHWSKRAARAKIHRSTAKTMLTQWGLHPELPVTVTLTRIGVKTLDGDNLQGACKAARDGVAVAAIRMRRAASKQVLARLGITKELMMGLCSESSMLSTPKTRKKFAPQADRATAIYVRVL